MARAQKQPAPAAEPLPLRLEWRSPAELDENPRNWRTHPEAQVAALTDVIAEVGWAGACLYNERTGRLIDGHARRKVALDKDIPLVPVLVGDWSEAQEKTILATLDPLSALAEADALKLDALLREVETGSDAVSALLASLARQSALPAGNPQPGQGGDEFDPAPVEEGPTRCQSGDLWVIGRKHRLLVGDCTVPGNVERLMAGEKVGLCFTSPPYAQQRDYSEQVKEQVKDWHALMQGAFAHLPMKDDGQVLANLGLVHRDGEWMPYWDSWIEWMRGQGWRRFGWYVWDQGAALPGDWSGRFAPAFEFLFHFNRGAVRPEKFVPCKMAGQIANGRTFRNKNGSLDEFTSNGVPYGDTKIPDSVVRVQRQIGSDGHPAQFPIGLPEFILQSWPADIYDPFLGSGTTLVAAHRLGRRCFGCEIEPRYADVILRRAEAEGLTCEKIPSDKDS
jgi:DNA modification methylase